MRAWSSSSLMALYFSFWAYSSSVGTQEAEREREVREGEREKGGEKMQKIKNKRPPERDGGKKAGEE